jgi:hypothetical protein
MWVASYI